MKATLEFALPEEAGDHVRAVNAGTAWFALHEIDNKLRNLIKYGVSKGSSYEKELSEIRKEIGEVISLIPE